jgi:hypothetical protein
MNFETAKQLVEKHINENWRHAEEHGRLIVVNHVDKPYGWVLFYTSEKYWETRDFKYAIAGNGPIIVEKESGRMHHLGTASPVEKSVGEWESVNWKHGC